MKHIFLGVDNLKDDSHSEEHNRRQLIDNLIGEVLVNQLLQNFSAQISIECYDHVDSFISFLHCLFIKIYYSLINNITKIQFRSTS